MELQIQPDWEQVAIAFIAIVQAIKGLILMFKKKSKQ